jgi:GT2 family glycosyltransferase
MPGTGLNTGAGRICAVVVTHNRKALLEECLVALLRQTRQLDEVVVIDNASADGTEALVKEHFPAITYVKLAMDSGSAGGFHEGLRLSYEKGHEWVWLMDDDATPALDALERLANSPVALRDDVYALACTVLNRDGSISLPHRGMVAGTQIKRAVWPWARPTAPAALYNQPYFAVEVATWVGLMVRRKAIDRAGLPNKDFFIYFDDTEYSMRISRNGVIFTISDSRISHGPLGNTVTTSLPRDRPLGWRDYYFLRNCFYLEKGRSTSALHLYTWYSVLILLSIGYTLAFRKSKLQGVNTVRRAAADGVQGRMGRNPDFI